jgi:hypothetical protein
MRAGSLFTGFVLPHSGGLPPRTGSPESRKLAPGLEVLGHSGISVTMNTYAHVLPRLRQEAADAIDEVFGASWEAVWQQIWQQLRSLQDRNGPLTWARSEGLEPPTF